MPVATADHARASATSASYQGRTRLSVGHDGLSSEGGTPERRARRPLVRGTHGRASRVIASLTGTTPERWAPPPLIRGIRVWTSGRRGDKFLVT